MTRIHADPNDPICDALEACFADPARADLFGAVRVSSEDVPEGWSLRTDPPLVTVYDDGGGEVWPVLRNATIRITVRARGVPLAKLVAAHAQGYLHDNITAGIAHVGRTGGTGFLIARDSDTGADMASFTVPATVRTIETV